MPEQVAEVLILFLFLVNVVFDELEASLIDGVVIFLMKVIPLSHILRWYVKWWTPFNIR